MRIITFLVNDTSESHLFNSSSLEELREVNRNEAAKTWLRSFIVFYITVLLQRCVTQCNTSDVNLSTETFCHKTITNFSDIGMKKREVYSYPRNIYLGWIKRLII